jgi:hypothetical protein
MAEILLGVLTEHLAFVAANGTFDDNFRTRSRRSVHVGWSHRFKLRVQRLCCKMNRRGHDVFQGNRSKDEKWRRASAIGPAANPESEGFYGQ